MQHKNRQKPIEEPEGMEPIRNYIKDLMDEIDDQGKRMENLRYVIKQTPQDQRLFPEQLLKEHQARCEGIKTALGRFLFLYEVPQQVNEFLREPEAFSFYCKTCDLIFAIGELVREDSGEQGYWLKVCPHCRNNPSEIHEVWRE